MKKCLLVLLCLFGVVASAQADTYFDPKRSSNGGTLLNIWADTTAEGNENANRVCVEANDGTRISWTIKCGEDESSYTDWQSGRWVYRRSGSKNYSGCVVNGDGYPVLNSVTCGHVTPTAQTPTATRRIFGDQFNADMACVSRGKSFAVSFETQNVTGTVALNFFWTWVDYAPGGSIPVLRNLVCA